MQLLIYGKQSISRQFSHVMKLIIFFMIIGLTQISAKSNSQNISFSGENVSLKKVFSVIKKQTGYVFFYDEDLIRSSKPVTLHVKNATVERVLIETFQNQPLTWLIENKTITILKKENSDILRTKAKDILVPEIEIRGKVVDENGNNLEKVTVMVKGTSKGTATNEKGEYRLSGVDERAILIFSIVGYRPKEVLINGRTEINVTLILDIIGEEEVVISTGYQTLSKERATGSFDIIDPSQLDKPATNIGARIIGQAAGVQASVDVNGNPTFEIRGQTSLYANSAPLIVVDGFAIQGDFNSINPNDVESVTILKDAAAASIWGARSANGVIVITTKRAKKETPLKVELNVFTRVGEKFDLDYVNPLASSAETVEYEKLLFSKDWSPQNNTGSFRSNYGWAYSLASTAISEFDLGFISEQEMNNRLEALKQQSNKSQISRYLLSNPVNNQVNLNLYGGSERMSHNLSLLYETNQLNFKESKNKRYMINYRTSAKVFNWLDFNMSATLQHINSQNNGISLSDIQGMSPYEMLLDKDGNYTNVSQYYWPIMERFVPMDLFPYSNWQYNPIEEIQNRDLLNKQMNVRIQGGLTFSIIKGLSFDSKIQYENRTSNSTNLYNDKTFYVRRIVNQAASWDPVTNKITPNLPSGSILTQGKSETEAYNFRNQLNFNRNISGRHDIAFVAGSEMNDIVYKGNSYPTTYGYNDETLTLGNFPNGPGGNYARITNWLGNNQSFGYTNSFSYGTDRYFSLYGNLAYTLDGKYTVSGSYRTDASNLITDDPAYRYAPFWSVGGGWNIHKEEFMKNATIFDDLRVRLTYGYNGNVDKSTAFRPLISMGSTPNVYTGDLTASVSSFGNPTLRWEKTGTWDLGVDFRIMKGKLFGKIDIYNKAGRDLIATLSIPAVNGTTSQKLNNAEMSNKGFEISLGTNTRIKQNDIVWRGSLNFSYNKNEITNLFVANYAANNLYGGGTSAYVVGKDANTLWTFEYAGIRESDNQPVVKGVGKDEYDFNGWTPGDGRDFMLDMGTKVAPYGFGFTSQFKIYDFDFSFIVTGKFGHVFKRQSFNYEPKWTGRILPNNSISEVINGDPNKVVPMPLNNPESRFYFWDRFYPYLSYLVESASHLRMQEINLTYNIPQTALNRLNLNGDFKIFVQGNNLFTVLANSYGEDPEYLKGNLKPQPQYTFGARFSF